MEIYDKFAKIYSTGHYPEYSRKMADLLPDLLGDLGIHPKKILDLACGEGEFAISLADLGYDITGLDISERMLNRARQKAQNRDLDVRFLQADMRNIPFEDEFDLVTCWYESLNYLLTEEDLRKTFLGVKKALREDGAFIFDVNTIYALSVKWQEVTCHVQREDDEVFEVHRTEYNQEEKTATLHITAFLNQEVGWQKISETHKERGYPLERIEELLKESGFEEISCFDDPYELTTPDEESGRVWFTARKQ